MRRWRWAHGALLLALLAPAARADAPKNVILLIGDGMGLEHVKAASIYASGTSGMLAIERLPHFAKMTTLSLAGTWCATDSAAAATAMATGEKVMPGVLSLRLRYPPGQPPFDADGKPLAPLNEPPETMKTLLELARDAGKRTGLVTRTDITDATPAGFAAHETSRRNATAILEWYLKTRPDVLLGGGVIEPSSAGMWVVATTAAADSPDVPGLAVKAGYTVVRDREQMLATDPAKTTRLWGVFGTSHMPLVYDDQLRPLPQDSLPSLAEMTRAALDVLSREPKGMFLMVEGGNIDKVAHKGYTGCIIGETLEFDKAVKVVISWAAKRDDTLVIVTADHETGGLHVTRNLGKGRIPEVRYDSPKRLLYELPDGTWLDLTSAGYPELVEIYGSRSHTQTPVGAWALGVNADKVGGEIDITDIFRIASGESAASRSSSAPASGAASRAAAVGVN